MRGYARSIMRYLLIFYQSCSCTAFFVVVIMSALKIYRRVSRKFCRATSRDGQSLMSTVLATFVSHTRPPTAIALVGFLTVVRISEIRRIEPSRLSFLRFAAKPRSY